MGSASQPLHAPTAPSSVLPPPQMEAEAAIGEGARLFCPNPQCSMLLLNDDKQADAPIDCPYWCAAGCGCVSLGLPSLCLAARELLKTACSALICGQQ